MSVGYPLLFTTFPPDTLDMEWLLKWRVVVLLTLGADCSRFTSKPAYLSPYLPSEASATSGDGKLGEYSNKSGPIIGN